MAFDAHRTIRDSPYDSHNPLCYKPLKPPSPTRPGAPDKNAKIMLILTSDNATFKS